MSLDSWRPTRRRRYTVPESWKGSPKVNSPARPVVFKSGGRPQRRSIFVYPLEHSGVAGGEIFGPLEASGFFKEGQICDGGSCEGGVDITSCEEVAPRPATNHLK